MFFVPLGEGFRERKTFPLAKSRRSATKNSCRLAIPALLSKAEVGRASGLIPVTAAVGPPWLQLRRLCRDQVGDSSSLGRSPRTLWLTSSPSGKGPLELAIASRLVVVRPLVVEHGPEAKSQLSNGLGAKS